MKKNFLFIAFVWVTGLLLVIKRILLILIFYCKSRRVVDKKMKMILIL